jgi:hypothetical protein
MLAATALIATFAAAVALLVIAVPAGSRRSR